MGDDSMALIEVHNNTKIYQTGSEKLYANKDISFSIEKGELVIIPFWALLARASQLYSTS